MDKLKMILFDGNELPLDAFGLPMHAVMTCANKDDMLLKWNMLTPYNLSRVEIKQGDETAFAFTGGKVEGVQSVVNGDGTLTVHFYMSGTRQEIISEATQEYITAAQIMMGEEE